MRSVSFNAPASCHQRSCDSEDDFPAFSFPPVIRPKREIKMKLKFLLIMNPFSA